MNKHEQIYKLTGIEPKYLNNSRSELKELNQPIGKLNLLEQMCELYELMENLKKVEE